MRLVSIFFTSFMVVFFGITFIYVQAVLPAKHSQPSISKKSPLAVSSLHSGSADKVN